MSEAIYAKGLYFNPNRPDTPDSVKEWKKGAVSIHIDNFTDQLKSLKANADQKGYVRFDLTKNDKNGEVFYSFRLNDWKPEKKVTEETAKEVFPEENINPNDIPF